MEKKNEFDSSLFFKRFLLLIIFIFNFNLVFSLNAEVYISETSTLTKLLNGQYSLVADGTIEVYNPSNVSKIYEVNIPLELDALIGISKVNIDYTSDKFDFTYDRVKGYIIEPNQSAVVGYHIFGLLNYNIYENIDDENLTVLDYYSDPVELSSNIIITLDKPQREGFVYDLNGTLNSTPISNSTRVVSSALRNPTDFDYTLRELVLYRTEVSDPFFKNGEELKTFQNLSVGAFEFKSVDFTDINSNDVSVYWVSMDAVIDYVYSFDKRVSYQIQQKSPPTGSGGGGSFASLNNSQENSNLFNSILLKKGVDKSLVRNGEEFIVYLRVVNVNNYIIENFKLYDEIPVGYEIKEVSDSVKLENGKLIFDIDFVEEYGTKVITYKLINRDEFKGITYLKPASLIYNNFTIYSEGVLVINDLLPDKKIFIQKEVKYIDENYAKVIIKVKNLGGTPIEDILISDFIDDNYILKDISQVFYEKGVWRIKKLEANGEWEVSYLIERNENLDKLPNVFGVDKSNIYGTLISSEQVVTIFGEEPRIIEKVGMGLAVGLLIFYLLF